MAKAKATGGSREFKKWLHGIDKENWNKQRDRAAEGKFGDLDDNRYIFKLASAEFRISEKGNAQIVIEWTVEEPEEFRNGEFIQYIGLQTPKNQRFALRDLTNLGFEIGVLDPEDLEEIIKQLNEDPPTISGTLKTKGDFQNLTIESLEDTGSSDDNDESEENDDDDNDDDDDDDEDEDEDEDDDDESEENDDNDEPEPPKKKKKVVAENPAIETKSKKKKKTSSAPQPHPAEMGDLERNKLASFMYKGKKYSGKIRSWDEEDESVKVKFSKPPAGIKPVVTVDIEDVLVAS